MELPDRVTVLTCIGCGAMGGAPRCDGDCSEHKLVLVDAADYDALLTRAQAARACATRLAPVARRLADAEAEPEAPGDAFVHLRDGARQALRDTGGHDHTDWAAPATVIGWWCAQCGNVDLPQPCIGVCVWRPTQWVNLALYERRLGEAEADLRAVRALSELLRRIAVVTPRDGQWQRNWQALRARARVTLDDDRSVPPPGDTKNAPGLA